MGKTLKSFAKWRVQESLKEYNYFYNDYAESIQTMFTWNNLPPSISPYYLERHLFNNGFVIFYQQKKTGIYIAIEATAIGLNHNEEPTGYHTVSIDGINDMVKAEDCVVIRNTPFARGSGSAVNYFAKSLSNIKKTFDVNLEQLKNPYIIACPENQKETVEQVMKQKTDGVPYIVTSKEFSDMVTINVFNLNIQNHTTDLLNILKQMQNEGLTHFGINNVNVVKKERLVTSEAEQNNEQISINKIKMYRERKKACEAINKKFGLNISVEISTNQYDDVDEAQQGGVENGDV